jgi:hypothetical protein
MLVSNLRNKLSRTEAEREDYHAALLKSRDYVDLLKKQAEAERQRQEEERVFLQTCLDANKTKLQR